MIRIAIIGMGLIGTSIGMAIRSADERDAPLAKTSLTGFDPDRRRTADARGRLAIDREAATLAEAVRDAHLIILAVPVAQIPAVFTELASSATAGAVVTDTASTKAQVLSWARELLPTTLEFVGGHPMAGREKSGPGAAEPDLFREAVYCLCPGVHVRQQSIDLVEAMISQIGAKLYYIDPVEHDAYVAGISHLPFILSAALVETTSRSPGWREMAPLAATGFRDIGRLASGDATMHRDICLTNREAIMLWIDQTMVTLQELRGEIDAADADALLRRFTHAREVREAWLESKPNMRPGEADFEQMRNMTVERPSLFGRWGRSGPDKK